MRTQPLFIHLWRTDVFHPRFRNTYKVSIFTTEPTCRLSCSQISAIVFTYRTSIGGCVYPVFRTNFVWTVSVNWAKAFVGLFPIDTRTSGVPTESNGPDHRFVELLLSRRKPFFWRSTYTFNVSTRDHTATDKQLTLGPVVRMGFSI